MTNPSASTRIPIPESVATYVRRELTGILTLLAVAAFDIGSNSPDPAERIPLIVLHALFFIAFIGIDIVNLRRPVSGHFALTTFVTLLLLLIWFGSNPSAHIALLFVLSAYAHEVLPEFPANVWVVTFGVASMIGFASVMDPPIFGVLTGIGALGGFMFIGNAARNRRVAEAARAESQRLLHELQVAHQQLQHHAHEAEVLAAAEERNRVARELHDTLGHRLTVAAVQLEGAQRLIGRASPQDTIKAGHMVSVVRGQVLDALAELRQTVAALHTPIEADLALPAAIRLLADQFAAATGLHIHIEIAPTAQPYLDALSRSARHTLFRATQEALTNIHKHARAATAWIQLDLLPAASLQAAETVTGTAHVRLTIHDDGIGMQDAQPPGPSERGFGLAGLAERAAQHNGTMRLETNAHGGTALIITLPIITLPIITLPITTLPVEVLPNLPTTTPASQLTATRATEQRTSQP